MIFPFPLKICSRRFVDLSEQCCGYGKKWGGIIQRASAISSGSSRNLLWISVLSIYGRSPSVQERPNRNQTCNIKSTAKFLLLYKLQCSPCSRGLLTLRGAHGIPKKCWFPLVSMEGAKTQQDLLFLFLA